MANMVHTHSFNRRHGPRKALIKGLVISLVEHGRIKTTLAKAKELRRHVERAVTMGKAGTVHARRTLEARFGCAHTADTLVADLGKRFQSRPGGYTRILKLVPRPGDNAPMALIEFVDYKLPETTKAGAETVKGDKDAVKRAKALAKVRETHRKNVRAMKAHSRRKNRRSAQ